MLRAIIIISVLFKCLVITAQTDFETKLFELPDVIFQQISTPEGYETAYQLKIKQPLDHKNPEAGYFYQRVFLSHKGYEAPTVMVTNGYGRPTNRMTEIAELLEANQIQIEHRYFLESCPDSLDYDYLNFEQVTADLHHINELFRNIYSGKWISSGISKGGTTTIMYRYFYPNDVDVSIPYVAPINHSEEDRRIYEFLDNIGSDECRKLLYDYQVSMLEKADEVKPFLKWYSKGKGTKFGYLNFDEAYEYAILEYPFSFWQWGVSCEDIPNSQAPMDTLIQHFIDVVGLEFYGDRSMEAFGSHYYQSGTEMGYYGFEVDDFEGLIKHLDTESNPSAIFMPHKMDIDFDGTLTNKVFEWTQTTDLPFIYINGALDTWSATAVPENEDSQSLWFFMEDKHHANARIKNMNEVEKAMLEEALDIWLK